MAGGHGLPEEFRRWHAERRWHTARNAWYLEHPEADHRLEDLIARRARRRAAASPRWEAVTRSRPVGSAERGPGTPAVSSPATRSAPGSTP
jgi:hypothetical protein